MNISQLDGGFNGRVFVPSNIKNNKQTILGKCDLRNIVYILIGGVILVTCFFIFKASGNAGMGIGLGLFLGSPFFLVSFIKFKGLNFEDFILVFRSNNLSANVVRINNLDNVYENLLKKKKVVVDNDKNKKKKKNDNILSLLFKKEQKEKLVDTDDNLLKIQRNEKENKKKVKKEEKVIVSSLIYN